MRPEPERSLVADRYRLDGVLGSGGVGRVWRGEDTVLRRPVAIKEVPLPAHLDDAERDVLRARVLREAQAAARIHHPGSVSVFDVVDAGDTVYVVMELVEDPTLADVVAAEGPLSPAATAAMGVELLGALAAAHAVGIVHRDVKPRNVMAVRAGGVKLADFGIASVRDDPGLTRTGMVLGTPSYMSPEQALGQPAGPAADVWGTGALLYFAVEGVGPFDRGEPLATLHAVVHEEPRPFERAGPLGPVVADLLAKDPAARPGLEEASARLQAVAATEGEDGRTMVLPASRVGAVGAGPPPVADHVAVQAPLRHPVAPPATGRPQAGHTGAGRPPTGPDRRGLVVAALATLVAIVLAGGIALAAGDDDPPAADEAAGTTAATTARDATTTEPPTTAPPTTETPTTEPPTTTAPAAAAEGDGEEDGDGGDDGERDDEGERERERDRREDEGEGRGDDGAAARPDGVPGSWVRHTDASGWSIWHPPGWQPTSAAGNATDIRDPATGDYLRVDSVAQAGDDPVAAWRESSARFAARYPDYRELRIERTTFQGHDAALWEYTYQGRRATNLGIVTSGPGYALNFQTAASRWEQRQDVRRAFEAGFSIAG